MLGLTRLIYHWTAGTHKASDLDKQHYHFIIEGDGTVVPGVYKPEDNASTKDGKYAAHTLNCNAGSIGVSLACMAGALEVPFTSGKYPMTKAQWDAGVKLGAELCKRYRIEVTPQTVLSHAEVQGTLRIKQRGKWDYTRLSWAPDVRGATNCGNLLRNSIEKELNK